MKQPYRSLCVVLLSVSPPSAAKASTINVPLDYATIQAAISTATDGDTVLVAPGTYVETVDFLGKAITVKSSGGAVVTIIDGNRLGSVVTFASGEGPRSVLEGFAIRNGSGTLIPDGSGRVAGGGIYCYGASPTISSSMISRNKFSAGGVQFGAGVFCSNQSSPLIANNEITDNEALGGAGIWCESSSATIVDNAITLNFSYGSGGGIACWSCPSGVIRSNSITDNKAGGGGGVDCSKSLVTIENNVISRNSEDDDGGGGVALFMSSGSISDNYLESNLGDSGGAINCGYSSPVIERNTILGGAFGDGIFVDLGSSPVIRDNVISKHVSGAAIRCVAAATISGNSILENAIGVSCRASALIHGNVIMQNGTGISCESSRATIASNLVFSNWAGGIVCSSDTPVIENNTVTQNVSPSAGAGIACHNSSPTIRNNIVWDNSAPSSPEIYADPGSSPVVVYSDVKGGYVGIGNIDMDPLFFDPANGFFSLQEDSPCIDTADPAEKTCGRDLIGSPRVLDGSLDGTRICDMGAFERDNVRLDVTGSATPGGTLLISTAGRAELAVLLFVGLAPGQTCVAPFGALYINFTAPWGVFSWPRIPSSVDVTIPLDLPTPLKVVLQELARSMSAGNTSNAVEITIE